MYCEHTSLQLGVTIKPIAILDDNYSYLIIDHSVKLGILIDPSEPRLVEVSYTN